MDETPLKSEVVIYLGKTQGRWSESGPKGKQHGKAQPTSKDSVKNTNLTSLASNSCIMGTTHPPPYLAPPHDIE